MRSQYKLVSGQTKGGRDEIFLSPYVLFLVVLTMKTNEAVGYQGCPIHLVLLYFLLPGPRLGGHWPVPSNYDLHSQSVRKISTIYTSNITFSTNNFACKPAMRLDVSNLCVSPRVITTLQQKQQPNVTLTNTRAVDHIAVLFYFYVYCIMYEEHQFNFSIQV